MNRILLGKITAIALAFGSLAMAAPASASLTVVGAETSFDGRSVTLIVNGSTASGQVAASDFELKVNGVTTPLNNVNFNGALWSISLANNGQIGSSAAVTIAKVAGTVIGAMPNFSAISVTNRSTVNITNPSSGGAPSQVSTPKYSGPEFSSFGSATVAGGKLVASGKKLDTITSMKIHGKTVTYKINSASELEIDLPKDLAPGKYDVEINSVHGKLTHLQGITIKAVVPTKELAFKADGAWLNYGSLLELTNVAKQIGSEYTSVKCIVNAADPVVAERLAKRACSYLEANRLRGKAVTYESKSTYKGEGFWVRVVANG